MTTLEKIQAHPRANVKGGLGSRNRVPFLLPTPIFYMGDSITMVDKNAVILHTQKGFNEVLPLELITQPILSNILRQLNS